MERNTEVDMPFLKENGNKINKTTKKKVCRVGRLIALCFYYILYAVFMPVGCTCLSPKKCYKQPIVKSGWMKFHPG